MRDILVGIAIYLHGLRFSKVSGQGKEVWNTEGGIVTTYFRRSLEASALQYVQDNISEIVRVVCNERYEVNDESLNWIDSN